MLITQQTQTELISWESFSIGANNSVHFENGSGATLNRVTGTLPSQLDGSLTATGSLYLVNKSGIAVGSNGMIATGGSFYASTHDVTDAQFLAQGDMTFSSESEAAVVNWGTIKSAQGDVALIARHIDNQGTISASNGTAALLAGYEVIARLSGDADGKFRVSAGGGWDDNASTSGIIEAMNVELRANGGSVEALAGNTNSIVKATAVQQNGGRIFLTSENNGRVKTTAPVVAKRPRLQSAQHWDGGEIKMIAAAIETDGRISVSGFGEGNGGSISITGEYSTVLGGTLQADGVLGGIISVDGTRDVSVEGTLTANGTHGGSISVTATTFANTGLMSANATTGNGGGVLVNAEVLIQHGTIEANSVSGNGGLVDLTYVKSYIDVARSKATANGAGGGLVRIRATDAEAQYFSSGTIAATGSDGLGGTVRLISGDNLRLVGALVDVSGTAGGGNVWLTRLGPDAKKILLAAGAELRTNGGAVNYQASQLADVTPVAGPFANFELYDPNPDNGGFGQQVMTLANGNVAVVDPADGGRGASYLYDGQTGRLVSALIGGRNGHLASLTNGNYLLLSDTDGTATFAHGDRGVGGIVSLRNSLIDYYGNLSVLALKNGNYVIGSLFAVTFGNGITGTSGYVNADNSLVSYNYGSPIRGIGTVVQELPTGNYVVSSPYWDRSPTERWLGAVTFGNGWTGVSGEISELNSLVGTNAGDQVGGGNAQYGIGPGVFVLSNGDYVVRSGAWGGTGRFSRLGGRGAVTLASGLKGITGEVTSTNSLVGTLETDSIGANLTDLGNGNFVVGSPSWSNGNVGGAGAATLIRRELGTFGEISAQNSLAGTTANERVGEQVKGLTNGNYIVATPGWDDGATQNVGAVTFANGQTGVVGSVSAANSLVGSHADDAVGATLVALSNGNYVVGSPYWDNGTLRDAGAVTWGDGANGTFGVISASNSLVGTHEDDAAGYSIYTLANGNYVVGIPTWDSGTATDAGATTWGNGRGGTVGEINELNSLVGSHNQDYVGAWVAQAPGGNYLVYSYHPSTGGAWTFGDANGRAFGVVSAANSLVGNVGQNPAPLANGNFLIGHDAGGVLEYGALTVFDMTSGTAGQPDPSISLVGMGSGDDGHDYHGVGFGGGPLAVGAYYALVVDDYLDFDAGNGDFTYSGISSFVYAPPTGRTGTFSSHNADIVLPGYHQMAAAFIDGSGFILSGDGRLIVFRTPIPQAPVDPTDPVPTSPVDTPVGPVSPTLIKTSRGDIERNPTQIHTAASGGFVEWKVPEDLCPPQAVLGKECVFAPYPDNLPTAGLL